jgi:hypothetical protein
MEFLNLNSYMACVFNGTTEPVLSFSKNNEPKIDFKNRTYGVKGKKISLASSRLFKFSQLRACQASLSLRYESDGEIAKPLEIIKSNDRHHKDCVVNNVDDYIVDKFVRYVEHRIVNEPNAPTYQLYECSRGDWVAWAAAESVKLPELPDF